MEDMNRPSAASAIVVNLNKSQVLPVGSDSRSAEHERVAFRRLSSRRTRRTGRVSGERSTACRYRMRCGPRRVEGRIGAHHASERIDREVTASIAIYDILAGPVERYEVRVTGVVVIGGNHFAGQISVSVRDKCSHPQEILPASGVEARQISRTGCQAGSRLHMESVGPRKLRIQLRLIRARACSRSGAGPRPGSCPGTCSGSSTGACSGSRACPRAGPGLSHGPRQGN